MSVIIQISDQWNIQIGDNIIRRPTDLYPPLRSIGKKDAIGGIHIVGITRHKHMDGVSNGAFCQRSKGDIVNTKIIASSSCVLIQYRNDC